VKRVGAGACNVAAAAGSALEGTNGPTSVSLSGAGAGSAIQVQSDGSTWWIISHDN